jgi:hypothetical protein
MDHPRIAVGDWANGRMGTQLAVRLVDAGPWPNRSLRDHGKPLADARPGVPCRIRADFFRWYPEDAMRIVGAIQHSPVREEPRDHGTKQSGVVRVGGHEGLLEFTEPRSHRH